MMGIMINKYDIRTLIEKAHKMTSSNGWKKDWKNGGCYLFLECAEFVESLRGKGNEFEESADVLIAFLSMIKENNIDVDTIISYFFTKTSNYTKNED